MLIAYLQSKIGYYVIYSPKGMQCALHHVSFFLIYLQYNAVHR